MSSPAPPTTGCTKAVPGFSHPSPAGPAKAPGAAAFLGSFGAPRTPHSLPQKGVYVPGHGGHIMTVFHYLGFYMVAFMPINSQLGWQKKITNQNYNEISPIRMALI